MFIGQVMLATYKESGAEHIFFDQGWFLHENEFSGLSKEGVCWAISTRWIKSNNKHLFFSKQYADTEGHRLKSAQSKDNQSGGGKAQTQVPGFKSLLALKAARKTINRVTEEYSKTTTMQGGVREIKQHELVEKNRDAGGFGSLNAVFIPSAGLPLNWEDWSRTNSSPSLSEPKLRQKFAGLIADQIVDMRNNQAARISLKFEGLNSGHAVAAARSEKEFMFFDPNGGLMSWKGADCADKFSKWFSTHFITATSSHYDKIAVARVFHFQLSKGRLPEFQIAEVTELPRLAKPMWKTQAMQGYVESYDEMMAQYRK